MHIDKKQIDYLQILEKGKKSNATGQVAQKKNVLMKSENKQ